MRKSTLFGSGLAFTLSFSPFHQAFASATKGDLRQVDNVAHLEHLGMRLKTQLLPLIGL